MQRTVGDLSEGENEAENIDGVIGRVLSALTLEEVLALFTKNYGALG